jgi:hypothetical protein
LKPSSSLGGFFVPKRKLSTDLGECQITSARDQPSEWCRWLHAEFHEDLVQQIKRKNRIRGTAALDLRLIQRLPAFVAGTSDLLV